MKFVMIKEYDYNVSKDKVIIGEIKESNVFDGIKKEDFDISIGF